MKSLSATRKFTAVYRMTTAHLRRYAAMKQDPNGYPIEALNRAVQAWATEVLHLVGVTVQTRGLLCSQEPAIFVGNHISYLDIPLLLSRAPVSFVAKHEIASWPLFGRCAKAIQTVFVKRESKDSRRDAGLAVAKAVREKKRSVVIFPSGTTCLGENKSWRLGAFRIAKEYDIPVQPFRLTYSPLRQAAYIDRDFFPWHLWRLLSQGRLNAVIEFGEPRRVSNPEADCHEIWDWTKSHARLIAPQPVLREHTTQALA